MALGNNCRPESSSQIFRKGIKLGIAIDFDGFFCRVANHVTIVAPRQMIFQFRLCALIDGAIKIVGKFVQEFFALHALPSPVCGFFMLIQVSLLFCYLLLICGAGLLAVTGSLASLKETAEALAQLQASAQQT